jgi:uncharacterized membrane protein
MPLSLKRLVEPPSTPGLLLGTLFFAFSLAPSLVPRPLLLQGLVSGLSLTLGYAGGVAGRWLWGYLELPLPDARTDRFIKLAATGVCVAVAAGFLWKAGEWQNGLRVLMGMEEETGIRPFSVGLFTLLVFGALLLLARVVEQTAVVLSRRLQESIPRRISNAIGVALALSLFWTLTEGVVLSAGLTLADRSYQSLDALIGDDLAPPMAPLRSGSSASLVPWEDLGRQGRSFVTSGPTAEDISAFLDEPAMEPIRVYVGLNAADDPESRARLAMEELHRVGAFQRSMLLLVTPTGTGWVDPPAILPMEYLNRGDIATVAAQYSYLSSPLALLAEAAYGAETARALFLEVYRHWTSLPPEDRPALYLHGVSLGALNSSLSFDLQDILADPFQGVLWSGPPFRTEAWSRATRDRDPDSPAWLPRYREGQVVRFMNQNGGLDRFDAPWGPLRIAYLQHASDPITFFSVDSFFREPEWMEEPRGPDVSPDLRWYPVVTGLQLAADMLVGGAPPGFGHTFAVEHYLEAWVALTEPEGWSEEEVARLRAVLVEREKGLVEREKRLVEREQG